MMIVFLLEERSTKELLNIILKKVIPSDVAYKLIAHDGKNDLRRSIPIKLKNWNTPDTRFVIVHDQDQSNCIELKESLKRLCLDTGKNPVIRIACHEMEAWYFGDLNAVSRAYGRDFTYLSAKAKYRDPDRIEDPKGELRRLLPEHEQISGARRIAPFMDVDHNTSHSFNVLIDGVRSLIK